MAFESVLRPNLLPDEFKVTSSSVKVIAETVFGLQINNAKRYEKTQTPKPAKNIIEVMDLIKTAIEDYDSRTHKTESGKINVFYSWPDVEREVEGISLELTRREPGAFSQGAPFEGNVKNLVPILREYKEDPEHPNYRIAVLGYWHDNIIKATCWARTNKTANDRALWLEKVMEEYAWFYVYSGTNRILYQGRKSEVVEEIGNNKYYGRPLEYFVRTETIRTVSEKTIEDIIVRYNITGTLNE